MVVRKLTKEANREEENEFEKQKKKYLQKKYRLTMYLHKKYCLSPHGYSPTKIFNKKTRAAIEECQSGKGTHLTH